MFSFFERLIDPYPEATPETPPRGFFAFLWACSQGLRKYLLVTTLLTAVIGAFEALLFAMLGGIVDWLSKVQPAELWTQERRRLLLLAGVLTGSIALVALQSTIKQQTLFGNFPDAAALELPPADARAEHELLPGRVRRSHRDQGDADRARRARHLADRRRAPGLRHHLFRDAAGRAGQLRPAAADPVPGMGRAVHPGALLLRAAARASRARAGRRALADDRPHHRRLHQHRHGQALFARAARGVLRALGDAGVPGHRAHADAAGHRLRDRQPHAVDGADRGQRRRHALAVDARARRASARSPPPPRWRCG